MNAVYLVDTSAIMRLFRRNPRTDWDEQIEAGLVGVCPLTELEILYSARSIADRDAMLVALRETFPWVLMPDGVYRRAAAVQAILTEQGQHRCAGPVDLLVAATAELTGLSLLHYDRDFDAITKVTGQPATWLAPAGSID